VADTGPAACSQHAQQPGQRSLCASSRPGPEEIKADGAGNRRLRTATDILLCLKLVGGADALKLSKQQVGLHFKWHLGPPIMVDGTTGNRIIYYGHR
jgi:hypothetical protein